MRNPHGRAGNPADSEAMGAGTDPQIGAGHGVSTRYLPFAATAVARIVSSVAPGVIRLPS